MLLRFLCVYCSKAYQIIKQGLKEEKQDWSCQGDHHGREHIQENCHGRDDDKFIIPERVSGVRRPVMVSECLFPYLHGRDEDKFIALDWSRA